MPRGIKKENLPTKVCVTCNRPFNWRKKWERCWDEVTTCSKSCNRKRREGNRGTPLHSSSNSMIANPDNLADDVIRSDGFGEDEGGTEGNSDARHQTHLTRVDSSRSEDAATDTLELDTTTVLDMSMLISELEGTESENSAASLSSSVSHGEDNEVVDAVAQRKAERKAAKKAKKAERRAQREGRGDPSAGQKQCDMCDKSVDLLIRCTYDESLQWNMVCGKCWQKASGGVVDGDSSHPYYRYGGLWKNRRAQK